MKPNSEQNIQTPQVSQPVSVPTVEPQKPFPKWILVLGALVLVILIAGGTFVLGGKLMNKPQANSTVTAPTSATAGWKTYTSTTEGFSFKYPTDWTLSNTYDVSFGIPVELYKQSPDKHPLYIAILKFETSGFNTDLLGMFVPFTYKAMQKNDNTYVLITYSSQMGMGPSQESKQIAIDTLNKIYSTFKFTDQTADQQITPTHVQANCGKEGTAKDASVVRTENYREDNRPQEAAASKKWESDAYLAAEIIEISPFTTTPTEKQIFASSCTSNFLVYHSAPGGMAGGHPASASIMTASDFSKAQYQPNLLQFPYNQALTPAQIEQWNSGKMIPDFTWLIDNTTDIPGPQNFTINGTDFIASSYTIQLNNSKLKGLFYDIIFTEDVSSPECSGSLRTAKCLKFKISALATADAKGKLLSFKKY